MGVPTEPGPMSNQGLKDRWSKEMEESAMMRKAAGLKELTEEVDETESMEEGEIPALKEGEKDDTDEAQREDTEEREEIEDSNSSTLSESWETALKWERFNLSLCPIRPNLRQGMTDEEEGREWDRATSDYEEWNQRLPRKRQRRWI